ncbi:MAG: type IX secretion system outer membrane channel protein PorV [Bacteroidota bacterium]
MKKYFLLIFVALSFHCYSQELNPIITAFPSLRIPTGSRGLGMGDCGVASANGNQQLYYNIAKSAFTQHFHQVSASYTPWLSGITNDTKLMNVGYLANISNTSEFGLSLSYLSLGTISTRDNNGATIAQNKSSEYNLLASYALQIAPNASLGVGLKFLGSQPGQVLDPINFTTIPKHIFTMAADVSYYQRFDLDGETNRLEIGISITNIGPKVNLQGNDQKTFLPTNLGMGISYTNRHSETGNQFTIALDANKLLIPTPPVYDMGGNIIAGKDPNRSVINALFSSFGDAPGGFKEELREIRINAGVEFVFDRKFSLRGGLSLENWFKGNRKFAAFGVGYAGTINDQSWGLDMHYLVPFSTITAVSPFQNNWGFTLKFSIGSLE